MTKLPTKCLMSRAGHFTWTCAGCSLTGSYFALTILYCPNLVPLLLVGWQSPPCKLTIASEYFAGMKPLATFRATINSISIRNKFLLITPVVHIPSHRRRSVLEQVETRMMGSNSKFFAGFVKGDALLAVFVSKSHFFIFSFLSR